MEVKILGLLCLFLMVASGLKVNVEVEKVFYLPLELVTVSGSVTYNSYPVQNHLVTVELVSPSDGSLDCRVLPTDEEGRFNYTVRLPYNSEPGRWKIVASTTIGGDFNASALAQFYVPVYNLAVKNETYIYHFYETQYRTELPYWLCLLVGIACVTVTIGTIVVAVKYLRKH